ncbi:MAG: DUF2071 domain-containing protein [Acidobacteriaceae bacterium]|nr:DUF2071 domain-containing protein [Acidobacteriaceae bacterium]
MFQNWTSLTFLHWQYPPELIQSRLPAGLRLDTFAGEAWIGVTPFLLTGLRAPYTPALPWISIFPEMNVRTYVIGPDGERGIWFFTLEAARLPAVIGARLTYGLPYHWAKMRFSRDGDEVSFLSRRHSGTGSLRAAIRAGQNISTDLRAAFLTARFRLYSSIVGRLIAAQVDHPPWPLRSAEVSELEQNLLPALGFETPREAPLVHFSEGVAVRVGAPEKL